MFVDPDEDDTSWMVAPFKVCFPLQQDFDCAVDDRIQFNGSSSNNQNIINGTQMLRVPNVPAVRVHAGCVGAPVVNGYANLSSVCGSFVGPDGYSGWYPWMTIVDPSCIKLINASAPDSVPDQSDPQQWPVVFQYYLNSSAASAAFCYATYEVYSITAQLDVTQGRLVPQAWDQTLVSDYFTNQSFLWARSGCVHAI